VSRRLCLPSVLLCAASCGYYNGMWSANHFAAEARRLERAGRMTDARASWAQAAVKAESVVAHSPHGRWADDALVLQGEGLAKSGACDQAAAPLGRALQTVRDSALLGRAALVAAECRLAAHDPGGAERLLEPLATPSERREASRATYLLGQAADQRGEFAAAAIWYARSRERAAGPGRARALLNAGSSDAALALVDTLVDRKFGEEVWDPLLADVHRCTGAQIASRTLDALLAQGHWTPGARARLLLADGDRLFAARLLDDADRRYAQVAAVAPDSAEGQQALVRRVRVEVAGATSLAALAPLRQRLNNLGQAGLGGVAAGDARALAQVLRSLDDREDDATEAVAFRSAEMARDSLHAPALAAHLFMLFASTHPGSLFAPKAMVAAATLSPDAHDSLVTAVQQGYGGSPYALALAGDLSPGYAAAEDSLGRALGVAVEVAAIGTVSRIGLPVPGPRGPRLDEPRVGRAAAAASPASPQRRPAAVDDEPLRGQRPPRPPPGAERP